jgi:two-component system, cell cycle sensor histidine kinase and response regulator CckA
MSTEQADSSKKTVFVVDDEEIIRDMTTDMLTDMGYNVITAEDGLAAVTTFELSHQDIDVVLLDMILPGMTGEEIFGKLQQIKPEIKVIFSSGFSIEEVPQELFVHDTTDFIEKPYRIHDLLDKISDMLKK